MPIGVYEHTSTPLSERFWPKVGVTDHCWFWLGAVFKNSRYGACRGETGRTRSAHRVAYELTYGPIPKGMTIDHLCRVRRCVNPTHLEVVTLADNIRRGVPYYTLKTHCPLGHEYTPENTYVSPNPKYKSARNCRTCMALRRKRYNAEDDGQTLV
jgi:hypothetical protein